MDTNQAVKRPSTATPSPLAAFTLAHPGVCAALIYEAAELQGIPLTTGPEELAALQASCPECSWECEPGSCTGGYEGSL